MRSVSRLGFHYAAFLVVFTALTSAGCATREAGGSRAGSDGPSGTLDSTIIDPASSGNTPPIADAGMDRIASPGDRVELDGSGSFDPDVNDTLTFMWNQTAGDFVELADSDSGQPSFLMPDVEDGVMLSFELTVSDGLSIATDVAEVHASAGGICGFTVRLEDDPEMDPPLDGPRDLNVLISAAISEDALAEGATLIWTINGATERELVADHLGLRRSFSTVGAHTIMLTLLVGDLSTGCVSSGSLTTSEKVTVWPMISGTVRDSAGAAIVEATVAANAGGTTAVTDASGSYVVHVPLGWSGSITAQHAEHLFSPSVYQFADLTVDKQRQFQEGDDPPQTACTNDDDCDDGLFCNGNETCIDGACEGGYDPCPGESCDESTDECFIGAQGLDCQTDLDCDHSLFCNGAERCQSGACVAGSSPCSLGETCNEGNRTCEPTPECTDDANCDDGNICNGTETCDLNSGICQAGTPLSCDDGDACTTDTCDPTDGCSNDPISCDDGNPCTDDTCDSSDGCQYTNDDSNSCDDNNECTENDACSGGNCIGDPIEGCETGTNYYIDGANGSDGNSGTESDPFKTIQRGFNAADPGDSVIVKAGTYPEQLELNASNRTGAPGAPITIRSENWYPNAAHDRALDVTITAQRSSGNNAYYGVVIGDSQQHIVQQYIVLAGLTIEAAVAANLIISNAHHITIQDCVMRDATSNGLYVGSQWGGERYIIIRRCLIYGNGNSGMQMRRQVATVPGVRDTLVEDCDSFGNGFLVPENAEGFEVYGDGGQDDNNNIVFNRCLSYRNLSSNFAHTDCIDYTLQDSIAWGTTTIEDADGRSIVIGNGGGGTGAIVRRCVSFDSPLTGLMVTNAPQSTIYNNTVFDSGFVRPGETPPTGRKSGITFGAVDIISRNVCTFDNAFDFSGSPDSAAKDFHVGTNPNLDSDYHLIKDGVGMSDHGPHMRTVVDPAERLVLDQDLIALGHNLVVDKGLAVELAENYANAAQAETNTWQSREQFIGDFADALRPAPGSPLIDAGGFLLFTTTAGTGTVIPVDRDPRRFFRLGIPEIGVESDEIQIDDGDGNSTTVIRVTITSMSDVTITIAEPVTFGSGAGISIPYSGNRPDIGAFEFQQ